MAAPKAQYSATELLEWWRVSMLPEGMPLVQGITTRDCLSPAGLTPVNNRDVSGRWWFPLWPHGTASASSVRLLDLH